MKILVGIFFLFFLFFLSLSWESISDFFDYRSSYQDERKARENIIEAYKSKSFDHFKDALVRIFGSELITTLPEDWLQYCFRHFNPYDFDNYNQDDLNLLKSSVKELEKPNSNISSISLALDAIRNLAKSRVSFLLANVLASKCLCDLSRDNNRKVDILVDLLNSYKFNINLGGMENPAEAISAVFPELEKVIMGKKIDAARTSILKATLEKVYKRYMKNYFGRSQAFCLYTSFQIKLEYLFFLFERDGNEGKNLVSKVARVLSLNRIFRWLYGKNFEIERSLNFQPVTENFRAILNGIECPENYSVFKDIHEFHFSQQAADYFNKD